MTTPVEWMRTKPGTELGAAPDDAASASITLSLLKAHSSGGRR